MGKKFLWTVVVIAVSLTMIGCPGPVRKETVKRDKIEHVARILMQNPHQFSLIIPDGNRPSEYIVKDIQIDEVKFIIDVPKGSDCWVEVIDVRDPGLKIFGSFHLHQIGEIEGGGWDHGKFGRGHTAVIE